LVNVAFHGRNLDLICPYDVSALPADVVEQAFRSHPFTGGGCEHQPNPDFSLDVWNGAPLSPLPVDVQSMPFDMGTLRQLRQIVADEAVRLQLDRTRADDLVLAVSEAATNSIQYGGGGEMALWCEADRLYCQITDGGRLSDPLVGRRRPAPDAPRGRGVWMMHQMCDLVQIRTTDAGSTVRLAMDVGRA
jgi:anti-sigma regulatory factor (Ser/Thr protein kinase)